MSKEVSRDPKKNTRLRIWLQKIVWEDKHAPKESASKLSKVHSKMSKESLEGILSYYKGSH